MCQLKIDTLGANQIPSGILYSGNFINCYKWTDKLGTNYLLTSESKEIRTPKAIEAAKHYEISHIGNRNDTIFNIEAFERVKIIYAYNYIERNNSTKLLWKYSDSNVCVLSDFLKYICNPIITDLNKDNVSETWLIYRTGCHSDVQPNNMVIMVHENNKISTLRGLMYSKYLVGDLNKDKFECNLEKLNLKEDSSAVKKNGMDFDNYKMRIGRYMNEDDFHNAPIQTLVYARILWKEYMDKDIDYGDH